MEFGSFCGGTVLGSIYGAVIVYLLWQMTEIRKKIAAADNPFDKFPDAVQPKMTAAGVMRTSWNARFTYALLVIFLVLFAVSYPVGIYLLLA